MSSRPPDEPTIRPCGRTMRPLRAPSRRPPGCSGNPRRGRVARSWAAFRCLATPNVPGEGKQPLGVVPVPDHVELLVLLGCPGLDDCVTVVSAPYEVHQVHWCPPRRHTTEHVADRVEPLIVRQRRDGGRVHVEEVRGGPAADRITVRAVDSRGIRPATRRSRIVDPTTRAGPRRGRVTVDGAQFRVRKDRDGVEQWAGNGSQVAELRPCGAGGIETREAYVNHLPAPDLVRRDVRRRQPKHRHRRGG